MKDISLYDKFLNNIISILTTIGLILSTLIFGSFSSILADIIFLSLLIFIYRKSIKKDFTNYFNKNFKDNIDTSIRYWMIGLCIMIISNLIIAQITNGTLANNEESVRLLIDKYPLYMAFQVMIYAPLSEELIFRKSISNITKNKYIYILLSSLIFGGLHIVSSISTPLDLIYLIPYSSLGFAFALLYKKTNNIFSSITMHSIHNTLALILYLIGG